jgi:putative transposase
MPRTARLVLPTYSHHVTQRGNYQQRVFFTEADYNFYLSLVRRNVREHPLIILAFCLMPNHVHFICIPGDKDSLANVFKVTHMTYSQCINKRNGLKGHLWQGRFFSSILDERYLYSAVRYVERNPVRAGLVKRAWDWEWSSARAHAKGEDCGLPLGDISQFVKVQDWRVYLSESDDEDQIKKIRENTLVGKPSANTSFIKYIEKTSGVKLLPSKRGRPFKK